MKKIILIAVLLIAKAGFTQENNSKIERKGFTIGLGFSAGTFHIEDKNSSLRFKKNDGAIGLPNLKVGYMLNSRLAIMATYAGTIYKLDNNKNQSFQMFLPTLQYWVKEKWWISGGFGIGMDSPALSEIRHAKESQFNFGYAYSFSSGYELVQRKRYTFDIQAKIQGGRAELDNHVNRDAVFIMFGVGFNWY